MFYLYIHSLYLLSLIKFLHFEKALSALNYLFRIVSSGKPFEWL